jgi:hypothetical protein
MIYNYILAAIIGWCGTGWPIHFRGGGGGGGVEPGDWPPNCPMCGQIIGAASAVILVAIIGPSFESSGLLGLATIAFFGGSFGSNLLGSIRSLASGR